MYLSQTPFTVTTEIQPLILLKHLKTFIKKVLNIISCSCYYAFLNLMQSSKCSNNENSLHPSNSNSLSFMLMSGLWPLAFGLWPWQQNQCTDELYRISAATSTKILWSEIWILIMGELLTSSFCQLSMCIDYRCSSGHGEWRHLV